MGEIGDMLLDVHREMEAEFNRAAGTDGWTLKDLPKLTVPFFDQMIEILGKENVKFMAGSTGDFIIKNGKSERCEPWVRASLLVSPDGLARGKAWSAAQDASPASDATASVQSPGCVEGQ